MVATRRNAYDEATRSVHNSNPPPPNPPTIEQALMTQTHILQMMAQNMLNN